MEYQYFKIYFDVLARQQNINNPGISISKIKSGNFMIENVCNDVCVLELQFPKTEENQSNEIIIYINYDTKQNYSFDSFIKTDYFHMICEYLNTSYEQIIRIGKVYDENYQRNLKPSIFSQYFITHTLTGPTGDKLEVSIDFLRNHFYLKTSSQSIHDTPLDDIILMDKFDYEEMQREMSDYKELIRMILDKKVIKLDNGYVIENRYYESLDRFLEERKDKE